MYKGIDVSAYQGNIDFKKVKDAGYDFVIIRASIGLCQDKKHQEYYKLAKNAGMHYGFYHFLKAVTVLDAISEAEFFVKTIEGTCPDMPVYLDFETQQQLSLPVSEQEKIIMSFLSVLEKSNYYAALYMSKSSLYKLTSKILDKYDIWIASWKNAIPNEDYTITTGMWQFAVYGKQGTIGKDYTVCASIPGVSTNVDVNKTSRDYPAIIKSKRLNGFKKVEEIIDYKEKYENLKKELEKILKNF